MPANALVWIVVPLLGAVIGYVTNRLAVKMIFRPVRPVTVLGIRFQGLIGRRQPELAASIGRIVGGHLVQHDDVMRSLERIDLERLIGDSLERGLEAKVEQLRKVPLVGAFLTPERVDDLRLAVLKGILQHRSALLEKLEGALEDGLDIHKLVEEKVAAFSVERLEALVLEVASRELRAIELLGGVLGFVIGIAQAGVIQLL